MHTYDFFSLYTTLPHNLIKEKLTELIERIFNREGSLYLACTEKNVFFIFLNNLNDINFGMSEHVFCSPLFFRKIYLSDLAQNYIDKLWAFQRVLIVLLLLQIIFCFVEIL